ncbi:hypothetical protein EVAR_18331_1 [Eumeta japonica]|uniref:Uncharacterized protein n=1 Tax=Eumeta variegata TaxID=151549 RepID=A0A4C1V976_EUMVA|nr:hypothetical protein EVAR_18331_1 [Eumeta japonica]
MKISSQHRIGEEDLIFGHRIGDRSRESDGNYFNNKADQVLADLGHGGFYTTVQYDFIWEDKKIEAVHPVKGFSTKHRNRIKIRPIRRDPPNLAPAEPENAAGAPSGVERRGRR